MDLVGQIINDLIDDSKPLQQALHKTLVLAKRLKNDNLTEWVSNELNGYKNNLPDYRILHCYVVGGMKTYFEMIDGVPIPLSYLEKGLQEGLQQIRMYENIAGLERIAAAGPDKLLYYSIDLELCGYITQLLQKNGQEVAVVYARQRISSRAVVSIISVVKTRLLDMMLELEDELNN